MELPMGAFAMPRRGRPVTIVIADDHPVVLHGITERLRRSANKKVLAACGNGRAALDTIRLWTPDIAVLDMSMPGMTGLDVFLEMKASGVQTKVVFMTATASDAQILNGIAAGAGGIVLKDSALDDLVLCIE